MLKVGITGGIGTGKSTVAKIFSILGVPVYEADLRAKVLIEETEIIIAEIKKLLGEESYTKEGKYDKAYVAKKVFQNSDLLHRLNSIVHPAVGRDFEDWISKNATSHYVIKEAAIMGKSSGLDKIIVVTSPTELRISRIQKRDNRTLEQIENIIKNQKTEEQFLSIADYEVKNNEEDFIITQVLRIDKSLRNSKN